MEIFAFHDGLKKWVEIGNSGMFRPEMLLPMGFPADVNVAGFGLSLERWEVFCVSYGVMRQPNIFVNCDSIFEPFSNNLQTDDDSLRDFQHPRTVRPQDQPGDGLPESDLSAGEVTWRRVYCMRDN